MQKLKAQLQSTLGDSYTLERELGGGGMSRVFLAEETSLGRKVVVKVLPPDLAAAVNLERFRREIQLSARLQHPHIIPVLAAGVSDGLPYYTMPFIEGESLRARLSRSGELPVHDAVRVLRDILSALSYAHAQGVVHRDIKPDNILFTGQHAVVADFGVAKAISASTNPGSSLTSLGVALGTPAYMAPEQAAADPNADHRADLYAVGAVAYEMLTGQPMFSARSPQAMLAAHVTEKPEPIDRRRASVPPMLAALIMRSLEKHAADRPQSAGEMLALLDAAVTPSGATAPTTALPATPRTAAGARRWLIAGAFVSAVLLAGAYGLSQRRDVRSEPAEASMDEVASLAVLPFENLGRDEDGYFADGMTEEISSRLGTLAGLRVIGRQSVRGYANSTKSAQQIGKELGVAYILTGSVRWDRSTGTSRVRVSPALLKVADGSQIWSEPYEDVVKGVFDIQSTVAERVANALQLKLSSRESQNLAAKPTENVEAYDLYLRGQALANGWVGKDYIKAAQFFEKATELDPRFALAFAALSIAHVESIWFTGDIDIDGKRLAKAKAAVDRANALSPNNPRVHTALANYHYHGKLDFATALEEVGIALRLQPSNAGAHLVKARIERRLGKVDDALATYRRQLEFDPHSSGRVELCETLRMAGQPKESLSCIDAVIEREPANWLGYQNGVSTAIIGFGDLKLAMKYLAAARARVPAEQIAGNLASMNSGVWPAVLDSGILAIAQAAPVPTDISPRMDYYATRAMAGWVLDKPDEVRSASRQFLAEWGKTGGRQLPPNSYLRGWAAMAFAFLGQKAPAVALANEWMAQSPIERDAVDAGFVQAYAAFILMLVGEHDDAIALLEKAVNLRIPITRAQLRVEPMWNSLRTNPRFQRLVNGT
ncbi:MAG: protein kinase [Gemmatimonadaceae bacterium]